MDMERLVTGIFSIIFGLYCAFIESRRAPCYAERCSSFITRLSARKVEIGPNTFRVPFILGGLAFVAFGILVAMGKITIGK